MKLSGAAIQRFLTSPDPMVMAVLVYGPDSGLVEERAAQLGRFIVEDLQDPFNVVELSNAQLKEDPARLNDEARAVSMMGGRRLIRLRGAEDSIAPIMKEYIAAPCAEAYVLLESENLPPRSPLRALFEKSDNAAALPCYVEEGSALIGFMRSVFSEQDIAIDHDALLWLAEHAAGDRQLQRRECEKLVTYAGPGGKISFADVLACCGNGGHASLDELCLAVSGLQPDQGLINLNRLLAEGNNAIGLIRILQNHFRRLLQARLNYDSGQSLPESIKGLQPPVFFKNVQPFQKDVQMWSAQALMDVLENLNILEMRCKSNAAVPETLLGHFVLKPQAKMGVAAA